MLAYEGQVCLISPSHNFFLEKGVRHIVIQVQALDPIPHIPKALCVVRVLTDGQIRVDQPGIFFFFDRRQGSEKNMCWSDVVHSPPPGHHRL
jgi:hypothetical protein